MELWRRLLINSELYMKKLIFLKALFFVFINCNVFAAAGHVKGTVQYIRVHNGDIYTDWKPPIFWFTLNGVTSAGSCPRWNGNILLVAKSEMEFSLILAAQASGKEIAARFDDTARMTHSNSWCVATHITSGNPPPLR